MILTILGRCDQQGKCGFVTFSLATSGMPGCQVARERLGINFSCLFQPQIQNGTFHCLECTSGAIKCSDSISLIILLVSIKAFAITTPTRGTDLTASLRPEGRRADSRYGE